MSKKTVFISHISSETELAQSLKTHLERHFLGLLEIFVSSDRETIQAGSKWLEEVDKALKSADLQIGTLQQGIGWTAVGQLRGRSCLATRYSSYPPLPLGNEAKRFASAVGHA